MSIRLFLMLIVTAFVAAQGRSQNLVDNVYVFGKVRDHTTAAPLRGVKVITWQDGRIIRKQFTDSIGRYEMNLDYDHLYLIRFEGQGRVSKSVEIDARHIPTEERIGGHGMNVDLSLFLDIPGVDFSILQQPIGKARFDPQSASIMWDLQYTEGIRGKVMALKGEYDSTRAITPDTVLGTH